MFTFNEDENNDDKIMVTRKVMFIYIGDDNGNVKPFLSYFVVLTPVGHVKLL